MWATNDQGRNAIEICNGVYFTISVFEFLIFLCFL